ncbi:PepSY-associated TM helix domain-containing protein [Tenacibaculum sp. S7007]|uniref:PepSY-associated TM helix domain-containing protein n=1 Tax=Tenacibaculum pelagium TaxID=2759527 RepID=A0A839AL25_9FLAO|nr:PepSY-associated TM helix domain-containing protein [Tenacibaculum pelagium]MBA6155076.1 PepSY-associated TM helix domain-containing protein [Tenacibaculum pelagium]
MKITNRSLHRDFAYFYVGLIIAFSFSGIILNHRQDWYPMDYTYENQDVELSLPEDAKNITKEFLIEQTKGLNVKYDGHRVRNEKLRIYFKDNAVLDADLKTGKGSLEFKRKVPIIGHSMYLHKSTNSFWIWYSDIFGLAMLLIAITGILIPVGKNGFSKRGWKLAIVGMLFPILFLVLFS